MVQPLKPPRGPVQPRQEPLGSGPAHAHPGPRHPRGRPAGAAGCSLAPAWPRLLGVNHCTEDLSPSAFQAYSMHKHLKSKFILVQIILKPTCFFSTAPMVPEPSRAWVWSLHPSLSLWPTSQSPGQRLLSCRHCHQALPLRWQQRGCGAGVRPPPAAPALLPPRSLLWPRRQRTPTAGPSAHWEPGKLLGAAWGVNRQTEALPRSRALSLSLSL